MPNLPKRLISRSDWEAPEIRRSHILGCHIGKVYSYWFERNAYHGNPSVDGPGAIYFDLSEIYTQVEERRNRGTHFRIFELPALVLRSSLRELVILETHNKRPLLGASEMAVTGETLFDIGRAMMSAVPDAHICIAKSLATKLPNLPFNTHDSRSLGLKFTMGWDLSPSNFDLDPMHKVLSNISRHLQSK